VCAIIATASPMLSSFHVSICGETEQNVFVGFSHSFAQVIPFGFVDGFDQPALFPIDLFGSAVDKFAQTVEVKFGVFGVRGDGRAVREARNLFRRKRVERRENAGAAVEIRARFAGGEPSKVSRRTSKISFKKSSRRIVFVPYFLLFHILLC
jgi:hypothetical protein